MRALVDDARVIEDTLKEIPASTGQGVEVLPLAVEIGSVDIHPTRGDDLVGAIANSNARDITARQVLERVLEAEGTLVENWWQCKFSIKSVEVGASIAEIVQVLVALAPLDAVGILVYGETVVGCVSGVNRVAGEKHKRTHERPSLAGTINGAFRYGAALGSEGLGAKADGGLELLLGNHHKIGLGRADIVPLTVGAAIAAVSAAVLLARAHGMIGITELHRLALLSLAVTDALVLAGTAEAAAGSTTLVEAALLVVARRGIARTAEAGSAGTLFASVARISAVEMGISTGAASAVVATEAITRRLRGLAGEGDEENMRSDLSEEGGSDESVVAWL